MINIKGVPLVHEEDDMGRLFNPGNCLTDKYLLRPIYTYLPNMSELNDEERKDYKFKDVKEGLYLTGLEVVSDQWVNKGFCAALLERFGLVLNEAFPIKRISNYSSEKTMIMLNFKHIVFALRDSEVSV